MKNFRGLFFKAVFVLTLISLVPVILIGFHLVRSNSRMLQREILQRQQTVANRLASIARSYLTHKIQLFSVFIDLHTDFGGHDFLNEEDLSYLRARDTSIVYLAVLNPSGKLLFFNGAAEPPYTEQLPAILESCVERRTNYVGPAYQGNRQVLQWLAFPIRPQVGGQQVTGILLAAIDLSGLEQTLAQAYPLEMEAAVVSSSGLVISYNGGFVADINSQEDLFIEQIQQIRSQLGEETDGIVTLKGGQKVLVTSSTLLVPDWKVYVAQPANVASQVFKESTYQSGWDMCLMLICVLLFLLGVSYIVIIPITRPVERLRAAALKLREREDYVIKLDEVETPHNELGDLTETMVEMSQVLHSRREALLKAQHELAQANQDLEKRVEERTRELKETTKELVRVERLASIGQMASIISHEIRNPLAVISNATRLIKLLLPSKEPKLEKQITIIETEIKQANSIISEVLGYARTRELMFSTIDVNSYLHDILAVYSWPSNVKVKEELDTESVRIKIDAEEIKQAIRNVISNAVDAMQPQGGQLTVGTKVGHRLVCMYIADTGPGIAPEVRKKMFAPFFTTKARGTGLGLAVVGKAIARHNGKLFINSEVGKGTCFQIYLKIYKKPGDTNYGEAS